MDAYAILDGGGVKGAALAGCLKAAEEREVNFVGYGGTSAGSIVALLACVGYTGDELQELMVNLNFTDFLDDDGILLNRLKAVPSQYHSWGSIPWMLWKNRDLVRLIKTDFGLYDGNRLKKFLLERIQEKLPALQNKSDITFNDLNDQGCLPFKVLVSDLGIHQPTVYSGSGVAGEIGGSVIDAVRASISYPVVFKPVNQNRKYLMDGGLSCNLPTFIFENERRRKNLPVIAFDLVSEPIQHGSSYSVRNIVEDIASTALESGENILHKILDGVYLIPIRIPVGIGTLDFSLDIDKRNALFDRGQATTHSFFQKHLQELEQARGTIEQLQALYAPPHLVEPVLQTLAKIIEDITPATGIRANIMLPTSRNTRIVVYQYGMDEDPDIDLELDMEAGCSGYVWANHEGAYADLEEAKTDYERWNLTKAQQNKIKPDRKAMLSVPLFDFGKASVPSNQVNNVRGTVIQQVKNQELIGVLSLDTETPLEQTGWNDYNISDAKSAYAIAQLWADILSRILR